MGGGGAVAGDLKPNDLAVTNGKEKNEDVSLVEFMYLVFTRLPGESYRRPLRSLLYWCFVYRALIISCVCRLCHKWGRRVSSHPSPTRQRFSDDSLGPERPAAGPVRIVKEPQEPPISDDDHSTKQIKAYCHISKHQGCVSS